MKVLLITMYFPPAGGGGVQRPLKLATHLPALGIETHVLAPDDPKWLHRDDELRAPTQAFVHRARYLGPKARLPSEELRTLEGFDLALAKARVLGRGLLLLYSVPDFWLALLALLLFAYRIPILPAGGIVDPVLYDYLPFGQRVIDRLAHLVLPVLTLTLLSTAVIARHQRSSLLTVLASDWMRTALAKGLSWRDAVRRHALRNALLSTITLVGLSLPALAAGAVFVEKVFSWPGMGMVTVSAIGARDYPLITAGVLVISVAVVLGARLADLAVAAADPRVRMQ